MLTKEQEAKARIALGLSESLKDNFEKEIAFDNHLKAVSWVEKYNLPYRLSLNYLKAYDRQYGVVAINPCYPMPGYPKAKLIHLKPDEILLYNPEDKPTPDGKYYLNLTPADESTRQRIAENNKTFAPWDLSTAAGRKQWEYYFAHFFYHVDFPKYRTFDYFGRTQRAKGDTERIEYWKMLQADIHISPERFMESDPLLSEYNEADYTELPFIPDWEEPGSGNL
jgi:hypothetical protein